MHHAVETGIRSAAALVSMRIKLLLGENVAAILERKRKVSLCVK